MDKDWMSILSQDIMKVILGFIPIPDLAEMWNVCRSFRKIILSLAITSDKWHDGWPAVPSTNNRWYDIRLLIRIVDSKQYPCSVYNGTNYFGNIIEARKNTTIIYLKKQLEHMSGCECSSPYSRMNIEWLLKLMRQKNPDLLDMDRLVEHKPYTCMSFALMGRNYETVKQIYQKYTEPSLTRPLFTPDEFIRLFEKYIHPDDMSIVQTILFFSQGLSTYSLSLDSGYT